MTVTTLKKDQYPEWNAFVKASPQCSLYAQTWYLEALDISFEILACFKKDAVKGGIVLTKDKWTYYINPVMSKYLGIYFYPFDGNDYTIESRQREVQNALLEEVKKLGSFEYTFHPNYLNWMPFERAGFKQSSRYTYLIDLNNKNLLEQANARLRNKILNAKQLNYEFRAIDDFNSALHLIEKTFERQGINLPVKREQLINLENTLKANQAIHSIGVYDDSANLLAALCLFYDNKTAYLVWNGMKKEIENGLNEALIFEGIVWAQEKGLQTFDFEGSMIPSIESFYRQFGGKLSPYFKIWKESKQRTLRNIKQKIKG